MGIVGNRVREEERKMVGFVASWSGMASRVLVVLADWHHRTQRRQPVPASFEPSSHVHSHSHSHIRPIAISDSAAHVVFLASAAIPPVARPFLALSVAAPDVTAARNLWSQRLFQRRILALVLARATSWPKLSILATRGE